MTLVDADTGEIVTLLNEQQARRLVARINGTAAEIADLIEQAWSGRAWLALGYGSWSEFLDAEITVPKLEPARRTEMVGALRSIGMSTRAIAAATGTSKGTVGRALSGAPNGAPALDRSKVVPNFKPSMKADRVETHGAEVTAPGEVERPARVTGTDGKTYKASAPSTSTPRRRPLPDAAASAGWEFRKAVERLARICDDDRFPANKEQVATHLRGHLLYASEVCQDLLNLLGD